MRPHGLSVTECTDLVEDSGTTHIFQVTPFYFLALDYSFYIACIVVSHRTTIKNNLPISFNRMSYMLQGPSQYMPINLLIVIVGNYPTV